MRIVVYLALCFILPALTVALTLGLQKIQTRGGITPVSYR